jgi:hypothetical protein
MDRNINQCNSNISTFEKWLILAAKQHPGVQFEEQQLLAKLI